MSDTHPTTEVQKTITRLLVRYNDGDQEALGELMPMVYEELQNLAQQYRVRERAGLTLDTRAVVHEAYIRLIGKAEISWKSRKHFYVIAARAMRRVLCDYARRHKAEKRGEHLMLTVTTLAQLFSNDAYSENHLHLILSMEEALVQLEEKDPRLSRLVELRFFYGMTIKEAAEALNASTRTINRDWQIARRFLYQVLK